MAKRKQPELDMTPVCDKCGAVAPIDAESSNSNWTVYETKEPCECGGKFVAKFVLDLEQR